MSNQEQTTETTRYIIKFCKDIQTSNNFVDSFVELVKSTDGYHHIIEVRTEQNPINVKNITLCYKFITNDFAKITYNDNLYQCLLEYPFEHEYGRNLKSVIKFDESSSSAYSDFKNKLSMLTTTQLETIYYPNGYIRYVGDVLYVKNNNTVTERVANGNGILYYNEVNQKVKYKGEWENGKFDGAGIFYSYDGKMSIKANNISNGVPTQKGKLFINLDNFNKTYEINFTELFDKLKVNKENRYNFVLADDFVKKVAKHYNESIDKLIFNELSTNDKFSELWNQINELNAKLSCLLIK